MLQSIFLVTLWGLGQPAEEVFHYDSTGRRLSTSDGERGTAGKDGACIKIAEISQANNRLLVTAGNAASNTGHQWAWLATQLETKTVPAGAANSTKEKIKKFTTCKKDFKCKKDDKSGDVTEIKFDNILTTVITSASGTAPASWTSSDWKFAENVKGKCVADYASTTSAVYALALLAVTSFLV